MITLLLLFWTNCYIRSIKNNKNKTFNSTFTYSFLSAFSLYRYEFVTYSFPSLRKTFFHILCKEGHLFFYSVTKSCPTFCNPMNLQHTRLPLFFTMSQSLLKFISTELVMLSKHLILCCPLPLLPSIFPSIRVFPMSWLFASGGQSIGASASVLPMSIQDWFPLGLIGLLSLLSKGLSGVFSSTTIWKHQFFGTQPSLWSTSHIRTWLLEKL